MTFYEHNFTVYNPKKYIVKEIPVEVYQEQNNLNLKAYKFNAKLSDNKKLSHIRYSIK